MPSGEPPTYGPPPGQYSPPQGYYGPPPAKTNVWAILSLIFGVLGLIGVPVSVICGIVGLKKAKQGQGGRGLAIAGLALSGAWVLVLAGIFAYYFIKSDGNPFTYVLPPKTGDCIAEMPRGEGAARVKTIDCADLHEGEVVAVLTMPDGNFPGQDTFDEYERKCQLEVATYSPAAIDDPSVGLYVRYPKEEFWANGYRDVTCVATFDPPRTGSIKGATDERSSASYFKTGDCLAEMPAGAQAVTLVDCDERHAAEVFAVLMLPDGDFPGQATIEQYKDKCKQELAAYAPAAANDPSVVVRKRFPDEKSWDVGDRSVTCIAALNPPRTGSLKG